MQHQHFGGGQSSTGGTESGHKFLGTITANVTLANTAETIRAEFLVAKLMHADVLLGLDICPGLGIALRISNYGAISETPNLDELPLIQQDEADSDNEILEENARKAPLTICSEKTKRFPAMLSARMRELQYECELTTETNLSMSSNTTLPISSSPLWRSKFKSGWRRNESDQQSRTYSGICHW